MSILDDHPLLSRDLVMTQAMGTAFVQQWIEDNGLEEDEVVKAMAGGATLAAVLGLDKKHIDALYSQAHDLLKVGELEKARATLVTMLQLDSSDERGVYALAASFQLAGDVKRAAQIYTVFCAMDATNPDGYLRLGECLLAAGERETAHDTFEIAALEAERGNGSPATARYAREMMAKARGAAPSPAS